MPTPNPTPVGSCTSSPSTGNSTGRTEISKGVSARDKFKRDLLANLHKKADHQRPFDKIRSEVLSFLHNVLKELLVPPTELPLHEIFVFSATGAVRRHLVGAPRAALHTALTDPWEYLENDEVKIGDPGEIPSSLPDICIAYKLHLECPKLINLFDWLVCWNTIVTGNSDSETPDQVNQARFARVVQELQHLGFIKSSTKKTDHVARLTFGGS